MEGDLMMTEQTHDAGRLQRITLVLLCVIVAANGCGWLPLVGGDSGQAAGQRSDQAAEVSPETTAESAPGTDTGGAAAERGETRAGGNVRESTRVSERTKVSTDTSLHEEVSNLQQSLQELKRQAQSLESGLNRQFAEEIGKMRDSIQQVSNRVNNFGISKLRRELERTRLKRDRNEKAGDAMMIAGVLVILLVAPNPVPQKLSWLTPAAWLTGLALLTGAQLLPLLFTL
jgi:hypothetical protein